MDLTLPLGALAWFTLVGGPLLTLLVANKTRDDRQRAKTIAIRATVLIVPVFLSWISSVELNWRPANWLIFCVAYWAWCALLGLAFTLRPRLVGYGLGAAGSISLLPGLKLAILGTFAIVFITGDYVSPPIQRMILKPGLGCEITGWGAAFSDEGHDVLLYRYLTWFPIIRHEVLRQVVNETEPTHDVPATTGCKEVAARLP